MAKDFSIGSHLNFDSGGWSDLDTAELLGRKVCLRPGFFFGVVEAIKLGGGPKIKVGGEWFPLDGLGIEILS